MDQTEALVKTIVEGLQEKKGKNIVTVDLTQLSGSICQYMIICEGSTLPRFPHCLIRLGILPIVRQVKNRFR